MTMPATATQTRKMAYSNGRPADTPVSPASVQNGKNEGFDLFGEPSRFRHCLLCGDPLSGRQEFFCGSPCRSEWHRIFNEAKAEDVRRSRIPTALEFARLRPDMVTWIGSAILKDIDDFKTTGQRATFRYYFESYRRNISGSAIMLNNNWQATFRQLVVNRFPQVKAYLKVRVKV